MSVKMWYAMPPCSLGVSPHNLWNKSYEYKINEGLVKSKFLPIKALHFLLLACLNLSVRPL